MTTQNTDYEHNDVDTSVVERSFAQETMIDPIQMTPSTETDISTEPSSATSSISIDAQSKTDQEHEQAAQTQKEESISSPATQLQAGSPNEALQDQVVVEEERMPTGSHFTNEMPSTEQTRPQLASSEAAPSVEAEQVPTGGMDQAGGINSTGAIHRAPTAPAKEGIPLMETQEEIRPFTDYIEEFRQAEARFNAMLQETAIQPFVQEPAVEVGEKVVEESAPAPVSAMNTEAPATSLGEALKPDAQVPNGVDIDQSTVQEVIVSDNTNEEEASHTQQEEAAKEEISPVAPLQPVERPVSPLLRPATRPRLPRHNLRLREAQTEEAAMGGINQAPTEPAPASGAVNQAGAINSTDAINQVPTGLSRPARRYRFDRPAPSAQFRSDEAQGSPIDAINSAGAINPTSVEDGASLDGNAVEAQSKVATGSVPAVEQEKQSVVPETAVTGAINQAPTDKLMATEQEHRRRHGQERQKEKEQAAATSAPNSSSVGETPSPTELAVPQQEEIAPEDLPPLEYSELQKASSRRRRRNRSGANNGTIPLGATTRSAKQATPAPSSVTPDTPAALDPSPAAAPPTANVSPSVTPPNQYGIVSGYTVNQMNQGSDANGPFMGPEPSPARGSVFTRDGRTIRADAQRTPVYPVRPSEPAVSPTSINQLASVLSQSIQMQTDRLAAELRRANQTPANISVSLPPFPSTERVGVFVDVANLLYSARTLRLAVDFGKLLDFLRGNRRLVRAHAYCPTSPQPSEDQMFLQAVKGLGYRITTKNYKTFSSGAKKADLDLDLCMDVVRLVEGNALDCVVLVSGDSDFMPLLDYCSDHGVRVEVAAFDEAMSATLRQSCDLFINLSMLEEIRA